MKQKYKKKHDGQAAANGNIGKRPYLGLITDIQLEMAKSMNVRVDKKFTTGRRELPGWSQKIIGGFRKTIFKPVLKLKPKRKMDWQNYGKIIGVLDRQITFLTVDIPRIIKEKGVDKVTRKQWAKIWPQFFGEPLPQRMDEKQARQILSKFLNRTVSDDEPLEKLGEQVLEVLERPIKKLALLRQTAFDHVSRQSAKNYAKFLKGMAQGYALFLDDACGFCGDRGRTQIYLELLSSQYEIEKMRRLVPARSQSDLQAFVGQSFKFLPDPAKAKKWFKEVCGDICLSMKGPGRPHKFIKLQMAPSF